MSFLAGFLREGLSWGAQALVGTVDHASERQMPWLGLGADPGAPQKPLDHVFAELRNRSCKHHGSCVGCSGSSPALPIAQLADPIGTVREVEKKGKQEKTVTLWTHLCPVWWELSPPWSLHPCPARPRQAVGHKPLCSLSGPSGRVDTRPGSTV